MKSIIGLIIIVAGIFVGLYAGVWWAFIGGIVAFVTAIQQPVISALDVATGCARVFFSVPIGWLSFAIIAAFGASLIKSDSRY